MLTHGEAINHMHRGAAVDASFKGIQFREHTARPTGTYFSVSEGLFSAALFRGSAFMISLSLTSETVSVLSFIFPGSLQATNFREKTSVLTLN